MIGYFRVTYLRLGIIGYISGYDGYFKYYLFVGGSEPNVYGVLKLTYPVMFGYFGLLEISDLPEISGIEITI